MYVYMCPAAPVTHAKGGEKNDHDEEFCFLLSFFFSFRS